MKSTDRRDFLKKAALAGSGLALPIGSQPAYSGIDRPNAPAAAGQRSYDIDFISNEAPAFEIPPYRGQWYEDTVPDTLDISERAKLAVNVLTSMPDPDADYEDYFPVDFFRNPPVMRHNFADWVQICESHMEDLPLMRIVTGNAVNGNVDRIWMNDWVLRSIGPDGLLYMPLRGRPWARDGLGGVDPLWTAGGTVISSKDASVTQITTGEVCGRAVELVALYYLRDRDPRWKKIAEQMVQRLSALAVYKDDYAYFTGGWEPNAKVGSSAAAPVDWWAWVWNGRAIEGLSLYYKATGYAPSLQLAKKLALFMRDLSKFFEPDGRWLIGDEYKKAWGKSFAQYDIDRLTVGGASANHALLLLALLECATLAGDGESKEFVRRSYEWARNPSLPCGVSSLVGWFPEIYLPGYPTCEGCTVGIMVSLAVKMSQAGVQDCWDDVDRWVRNQFAEMQLTSADWVHQVAGRSTAQSVGEYETANNVPERNIGAFAGWSSGNDWATHYGVMHCCTGNCIRALYHLWENMITCEGAVLKVNMLMNRASAWADVYSYIPYEGRVELKSKVHCKDVLLRAPEWIQSNSGKITCHVNGVSRSTHWEKRYLSVGEAKPGDMITIAFPIPERNVRKNIGTATYSLVLKGNTVVAIDPPGKNGPLYQRAEYRREEVRRRTVKRFISAETLLW